MKNNYKSLLFVPAVERFLNKVIDTRADAVIFDLEDAVSVENKDYALELLERFLEKYSYNTDTFVRINPSRIEIETKILNEYNISGYMLPKTETYTDIKFLSDYTDKKIIALIETSLGVINSEDIASFKAVDMLAFGAEDYTSSLGIKNNEKYLNYPKSKIICSAGAYNKSVFDTISLNITDMNLYRNEVIESLNYGFCGKLAIHPKQVEVINDVFYNIDYELYNRIISEYEKNSEAVCVIDGQVYEKPHIDKLKLILNRRQDNVKD